MRKKVLCLIILSLIIFSLISIPVLAASSGNLNGILTWTLDDNGTLTISGRGAMPEWTYSSAMPWWSSKNSIKTIIIEDGVTSIGKYAFYECYNVKNVTIPNSVTNISEYAFYYCKNLENILIPSSVTTIQSYAFAHCNSFTSIPIPNSVTSLGGGVFSYCNSLKNIDWNNNIESIPYGTFMCCENLESVTIQNNVRTIGESAFYGCNKLSNVKMPCSLRIIYDYAFSNCTALKSITIPNGVTEIGDEAFSKCSNLKYLTLPSTLRTVKGYVFYKCSISDVYYGGTEEDWNNVSFYNIGTYLENATMHYSVKSMDVAYVIKGTETRIKIVLEGQKEGSVIVASYEDENKLIDLELLSTTSSLISIVSTPETAKHIKIMWWEFGTLKPYLDAIIIEL